MFLKLQAENKARLDAIEAAVKRSLQAMDDRAKDVQAYIVKEIAAMANRQIPDANTSKQ